MSKEYEGSDIANTGRRNSMREIQEMEQIERGLEAFLEQELQNMKPSQNTASRNNASGNNAAHMPGGSAEGRRYAAQELLDPPINVRMEREEKGIDVIGSSRRGSSQRRKPQKDYIEDWDISRGEVRSGSSSRRSGSGSERGAGSGGRRSSEPGSRRGAESGGRRSSESGSRRSSESRGRRSAESERRRSSGSGSRGRQEASENTKAVSRGGADKPRKKPRFKRLKRFLIMLAVIVIVLGAGLYWLVGSVYKKMKYEEIASVAGAPYKQDGVINILLIGNDSRENGQDGRSDAMILISISNRTKKIYMTSLLRDMYVEIPGHDGNRLNAAYSFGGAELLMETIEQNFDISVNRYVLVNFEAFANLVDAVGGVDLELTSQEIEYVNGYLVEYNILTGRPQGTDNMDTSVSGLVHLNGPQALAYSRNRYLGTDFGRTERQRKVLTAVIKKLPVAMLTNPGELIDGLLPNLTTNLTQGECYLLSLQAWKMLGYDIEQSSIPLAGTYRDVSIRGMSVLEVDFEENRKYLQENIYGKTQ